MSALQLTWLANHYEQGKITPEEFASLYSRITLSEKQSAQNSKPNSTNEIESARKVARLHPETRRTLARVRSFKSVVKFVNYSIVIGLISIIYLTAEHYQTTGSLPEMNLVGLENLLTQAPLKPLPSDIKQAAKFLSNQSAWNPTHVSQFAEIWKNTLIDQRQTYVNEHWFQEFRLALSLHIIEQKKFAKSGVENSIRQALILTTLEKRLEDLSA